MTGTTPTPSGNPPQVSKPPPLKRVRRACDYCRRKRLKCTADRRPCLNCQLYGAECVSESRPRAAGRVPTATATAVAASPRKNDSKSKPAGLDADGRSQHAITAASPATTIPLVSGSSQTVSTFASQEQPGATDSPDAQAALWDPAQFVDFHQLAREVGIGFSIDPFGFDELVDTSSHDAALFYHGEQSELQTPQTNDRGHVNSTSSTIGLGKVSGMDTLGPRPPAEPGTTNQACQIAPGLFIRKAGGDSNFIGLHHLFFEEV
jgi:hypothetical protein